MSEISGHVTSSYGLLNEVALLVECLAPRQNCIKCIICAGSNSPKKAICAPKLQRLVHCCCYVQLHVVLRKGNNIVHSKFTYKLETNIVK